MLLHHCFLLFFLLLTFEMILISPFKSPPSRFLFITIALTWGVFPNREILQPTVFDHDSFVVWSEEVRSTVAVFTNSVFVRWFVCWCVCLIVCLIVCWVDVLRFC